MEPPEMIREPCPDRILDDVGGAFGMGAVGGSAFHFIKGAYGSPSGARLLGATQAIRMNAPRVGGSFAVWGALFSTFDCSMVYLRQKEDPWNSILAGAAAGGLLQMRRGLGATARSAALGGVLLALIEGATIMTSKVLNQPRIIVEDAGVTSGFHGYQIPASPESSESLFGGWFGGGQTKDSEAGRGDGETTILDSFDAPPVPNYEFK